MLIQTSSLFESLKVQGRSCFKHLCIEHPSLEYIFINGDENWNFCCMFQLRDDLNALILKENVR
jgi:hypothetical protein